MKYELPVKPSKVLPPSYIRGYYEKDPQTLVEVRKWLAKNGLTILFTRGDAYGDESVYLGKDDHIYIGTDKTPDKDWVKRCLLKIDRSLLESALKEKWSTEKMFDELKKHAYKP